MAKTDTMGGSEGVVFFGRNFSRLSFLNTSLIPLVPPLFLPLLLILLLTFLTVSLLLAYSKASRMIRKPIGP